MLNIADLALRLDADEKLKVRYKFPKKTDSGVTYVERCGKLLDVELEKECLFVSQDDAVVWVKLTEAIEVMQDDGIYD